jgi:DNA-binding Lrp family transcriptional regulator
LIEVKVTPSRDGGFDRVARRIAKFPEVTDLCLLSGSYDLQLTVEGDSLQQVANFVAAKLATIDGVISTSTGFQLKKYKESGIIMQSDEEYERLKVCF